MNSRISLSPSAPIETAILETLAYFDGFDFPVRANELHRYLHGLALPYDDFCAALSSACLSGRIETQAGYYVLPGRRCLIDEYQASAPQSARRLRLALKYGRLLARLPFVRMVAVTGSVSMQAGGPNGDFDYLLITEPGRLWLARLFAVAVGRLARLAGHTLCPNILLSTRALLWPRQDPYAAHELTQMIPVSGLEHYEHVCALNAWALHYLPNAGGPPKPYHGTPRGRSGIQRLLEPALRGSIGSAIEKFEMERKLARLRLQPGFGPETVFSADVCQGNFQNHGDRIRRSFEARLRNLGLTPSDVASPPAASYSTSLDSPVSAPGTDSAGLQRRTYSVVAND